MGSPTPWPNHWNDEQLFHSGDHYFSAMIADIQAAKHTIDLETYIYDDDGFGKRFCSVLCQAAKRGVRVRLMVDGWGSPGWAIRYQSEMVSAGVDARVFHPLPWLLWSYILHRVGQRGRLFEFYQKLNRRNHRKVCVIDRDIAWVGSMNISAHHLKEFSGENAWRDSGIRVEGEEVAQLSSAFAKTWTRAQGVKIIRRIHELADLVDFSRRPKRDRRADNPVRLNDNRVRRRRFYRDLLLRMIHAKKRIWITNAYFVPDGSLLRVLRLAAWSGVDVRILVPRKSDVFFIRWVTAAFYGSLLKAGVRVYEYLPTILHAKTVVIDEWGTVGSTNLNYRSFLHNLEVDVVVTTEESCRSLAKQFEKDLKESREMSIGEWKRLSWLERWGGKIMLMFKYWI